MNKELKYKIDKISIKQDQSSVTYKVTETSLVNTLALENEFTVRQLESSAYSPRQQLVLYHNLPNDAKVYVFGNNTTIETAIHNTLGVSDILAIDNLFNAIMDRLSSEDIYKIIEKHEYALDKYMVAKLEIKKV